MNTFFKSLMFALITAFIFSSVPVLNAADEFTADIQSITTDTTDAKAEFNQELASEFNVPAQKVEELTTKEGMTNGDAYMALETSRQSKKPLDDVVKSFKKNKAKGWGFIAKDMGIKPGSPEFKALKEKSKEKSKKMKDKKKGGKDKKGKSEEKGKKK